MTHLCAVQHLRVKPALVVISVLALAFASCARVPTPEDANNAVLSLRGWGSWAWALAVGLIWADLVLPIPQTAVIAALGIIYGSLLGGLLGSLGLITSLIVLVGIVPTFAWRAGAEERLLSRTFGERYALYRRHTKMIIPHLF